MFGGPVSLESCEGEGRIDRDRLQGAQTSGRPLDGLAEVFHRDFISVEKRIQLFGAEFLRSLIPPLLDPLLFKGKQN